MTKVSISENYGHYILKAEGHTGFGSFGNDILCSAISVLIESFLEYAKTRLAVDSYRLSEGKAEMIIKKDNTIKSAMEMCIVGLNALAEQYPKNIRIKIDKEILI